MNRRYGITLLLTAVALLATACAGRDGFTDEDKAELVRLTLERALIGAEIPDYALLVDQSGADIVLSTANIGAEMVPELLGFNLIPLTAEEIQARANVEGDFLRLQFKEFQVLDADTVIVGLDNSWVTAEDSTTGYLSGGGFELRYERQGDGWVGEVTSMWIS
jgi:hypothetical protein